MVKTLIDGIGVQEWITDYAVDNPPVYGNNSFVDASTGIEIQDKIGDKVILNITLEDMPTPVALQVAEALQKESVLVDYTTPVPKAGLFRKTAYKASCSDANSFETDYSITDGIKWDISVTLESVDYAVTDSSGL